MNFVCDANTFFRLRKKNLSLKSLFVDKNSIMLFVGTGIAIASLIMCIKCAIDIRRTHVKFNSWARRDEELTKAWFRALDMGDYDECRRLRYQMNKNLEGWKNSK